MPDTAQLEPKWNRMLGADQVSWAWEPAQCCRPNNLPDSIPHPKLEHRYGEAGGPRRSQAPPSPQISYSWEARELGGGASVSRHHQFSCIPAFWLGKGGIRLEIEQVSNQSRTSKVEKNISCHQFIPPTIKCQGFLNLSCITRLSGMRFLNVLKCFKCVMPNQPHLNLTKMRPRQQL